MACASKVCPSDWFAFHRTAYPRVLIPLVLSFVSLCASAVEPPTQPSSFSVHQLGPADPLAVVDYSLEEDCALCAGVGLVNFEEFADVLHRSELAEFLNNSRATQPLRRAIWECAIREWPTFVDSLGSRRVPNRDAMIRSSHEWGKQLDRDEVPDARLISRHSALVVRIQSERSTVEARFLLGLADCASDAIAVAPSGDGPSIATSESCSPMRVLAPLIQRAKSRGAQASILGRSPRWMSVDPRALLLRCALSDTEWLQVDEDLAAFEASRSSLTLARFRAEWSALGRDSLDRGAAWHRVESLERHIRRETRATISVLQSVLNQPAADELFLLATGAVYPEIAPTLREVAMLLTASRETAGSGEGARAAQEWSDALDATLHRVIDDLNLTTERSGFLWVRAGDVDLEASMERARATLNAAVAMKP